jgi:hypothetical protein
MHIEPVRMAVYNPIAANEAMGHFDKYDFQRSYTDYAFIGAYTDASNFSVGMYMRGAGFSRERTIAIGSTFARLMSNAGAAAQLNIGRRVGMLLTREISPEFANEVLEAIALEAIGYYFVTAHTVHYGHRVTDLV